MYRVEGVEIRSTCDLKKTALNEYARRVVLCLKQGQNALVESHGMQQLHLDILVAATKQGLVSADIVFLLRSEHELERLQLHGAESILLRPDRLCDPECQKGACKYSQNLDAAQIQANLAKISRVGTLSALRDLFHSENKCLYHFQKQKQQQDNQLYVGTLSDLPSLNSKKKVLFLENCNDLTVQLELLDSASISLNALRLLVQSVLSQNQKSKQ